MQRPSLVRNFVSLSGAEVLSKLLTLVAFAYVARVAGPTGFGYLEFASSVVMCAALVVDQGFGVYGAREIARAPEASDRLIADVGFIRVSFSVLVYAGLVAFVMILDRGAMAERLILLYGLSIFPMPWMLSWVFQGHDRMQTVAALQITRQAVFAGGVFVLFRDAARLWPVAVAELGGVLSVAIGSVYAYRRQFGHPPRIGIHLSRHLLREGSMIGLGQIFWSLRMYGATVVLGLIASEEDVGFFGAAMRIAIGLYAFVWLYFYNLLPSLSRAWRDGGDAMPRLIGRSLGVAGSLSLLGGVAWVLLAPAAVRIAYGDAFAPAAPVLRWLSGVCILAAMHGHFRYGLIAAGRQTLATVAMGIGTVIALVSIPFAYRRFGPSGAAVALVVGELAVGLSAYLASRRVYRVRPS